TVASWWTMGVCSPRTRRRSCARCKPAGIGCGRAWPSTTGPAGTPTSCRRRRIHRGEPRGSMITGSIIAETAALVGDPARAAMLSASLDGRPLTASELAGAAHITPQTASTHLAKLTEAGVLSMVRDGRHRRFRLASPTVVEMIEGIVAVALQKRPRYRPLSDRALALSAARICYDHLAGRLSIALPYAFVARNSILLCCDVAEITPARTRFFTAFR